MVGGAGPIMTMKPRANNDDSVTVLTLSTPYGAPPAAHFPPPVPARSFRPALPRSIFPGLARMYTFCAISQEFMLPECSFLLSFY